MTIERNMVSAAAAVIGLLGALSSSVLAHADPIPVPPNCNDQFLFETIDLDITQDDGTDVFPPTVQNGTAVAGQGYYLAGPARKKTTGSFTGAMSGNAIHFTGNWDTGGWNKYTGTINPDGSMNGSTVSNTGVSENWRSGRGSVKCNPAAAPPVAPPAAPQAPAGGGGTPAGGGGGGTPPPSHTITGDVDLYDKPGGNGKIIGHLKQNDAVTLNGPCPIQSADNTNGWCLVTDTTQQLSGAVWGDFVSH